jgi:hypothetical protein
METAINVEHTSAAVPDASKPIDIVSVFHWDSTRYCGDLDTSDHFLMEVTDQRQDHGRMFVDVATENGDMDDVMSVSLEINRLPGSKADVQCMHVSFDPDNMAFSLFKQGDRYILRPEAGVDLRPTVLPDGTSAFILE